MRRLDFFLLSLGEQHGLFSKGRMDVLLPSLGQHSMSIFYGGHQTFCSPQNHVFFAEHGLFLTLTMWIFHLNLTRL